MTMPVIPGVLIALALTGCAAGSEDEDAADRAAIVAILDATEAAENAGSADRMRIHFADDIVIMAPNTPVVTGADEVAAAMSAFFEAFDFQIDYSSEEVVIVGDWAFDRGTYGHTRRPRAGGEPIHEIGKYLWLYHRAPDGSWNQARVIWNSSGPPAASGG